MDGLTDGRSGGRAEQRLRQGIRPTDNHTYTDRKTRKYRETEMQTETVN